METNSFGITDQGRVRSRNEDSYLKDDEVHLYVVADGMGGHAGGDVASKIAVEKIREAIVGWLSGDNTEPPKGDEPLSTDETRMEAALKRANEQIFREAELKPEFRGMGTTTTGILVTNNQGTIAHVGDSRAYLLRGGVIRQITEDHSWVNEQVKAGFMTVEEARNHRLKNVITRSLGHEENVKVDLLRLDLAPGDKYLLCSDGLSNMVTDDEMNELVTSNNGDEALQKLVDLANERGGFDNITAVLVEVLGE